MKRFTLALIVLLILSFGCQKEKETIDHVALLAEEMAKLDAYMAENHPELTKTGSGFYMKKLREGTGMQVKSGNYLEVHYHGTLLDGTVFDSSYGRGEPFRFRIGMGSVIRSWDEALLLTREGDKILLITPSSLAYGPFGSGGIGPYTSLIFEIEVLSLAR